MQKATELILYQNARNIFSQKMAVLLSLSNAVERIPEGQPTLSKKVLLTFVVQKFLAYDFVLEIKNLKCF